MRKIITHVIAAVGVMALVHPALGQENDLAGTAETFASENAVLDTSILLAVGAREARQELRGAFGWPTFQEGSVNGVYFRFDPDGYARFAPTPRLDSDVFEVICRPRTLVCMGRKGPLQVTLTPQGAVQLDLTNAVETDQFLLTDGVSELPLPSNILQPLEQRLELLLASGGQLVAQRNGADVINVSLAGFEPVISYLRWVAARQDYSVLPVGWPVPNGADPQNTSQFPQTNNWPARAPSQRALAYTQASPGQTGGVDPNVGKDVAEVRGELNVLRELLLDRVPSTSEPAMPPTYKAPVNIAHLEARVQELATLAASLEAELASITSNGVKMAPSTQEMDITDARQMPETRDLARHLDYLMTEVGLPPDVALLVIQQSKNPEVSTPVKTNERQDDVIDEILRDLRAQLPEDSANLSSTPASAEPGSQEWQLFSDYMETVLKRP